MAFVLADEMTGETSVASYLLLPIEALGVEAGRATALGINNAGQVRGDLRQGLAALAAEAPWDLTLVIFHTAVLSYVPGQADREDFAASVTSLCNFWIANESPRVFPAIAEESSDDEVLGRFLPSVNGAPAAWTNPHGAALDWIAEPSGPTNR